MHTYRGSAEALTESGEVEVHKAGTSSEEFVRSGLDCLAKKTHIYI